jgi:hypothetical protein
MNTFAQYLFMVESIKNTQLTTKYHSSLSTKYGFVSAC